MRDTNEAVKWLQEYLSDGELHLVDNVRAAYKEKGFASAEVKAARKLLGVKTFHQFDEDGQTPNWYWYIGG